MMPHLSSEQIAEYLLDQPHPAAARHVLDCAACRAELERQRETLAEFRGAVRAWSGEQAASYRSNAALAVSASKQEPHSWPVSRQLAWALAIAAFCVLASLILPRYTGQNSISDAALLDRVNAEVTETVPSPMAPLMKLVVQEQVVHEQ